MLRGLFFFFVCCLFFLLLKIITQFLLLKHSRKQMLMSSISLTDSQAVITGLQLSKERLDKQYACRCHSCPSPLMAISRGSTCHYPADTVQQVVSHWHWLPYVSTSVSGQLNQPSSSPSLLPRILLEAYFQGDESAHLLVVRFLCISMDSFFFLP